MAKPPGYGMTLEGTNTGNPLLDAFTQARAGQTQAALEHAKEEAQRFEFEHKQKMDVLRQQLEEDHLKYLQDQMAQQGQQFTQTQGLAREKFEADKTQDAAQNAINTERNQGMADDRSEGRAATLLNGGATQGVALAGMRPDLRQQYVDAGVQSGQSMRGAQAMPGVMGAMQNPTNPFNPIQTMRDVGGQMPAPYTEKDFLSSQSAGFEEKKRHAEVVEGVRKQVADTAARREADYLTSIQNNRLFQDARMQLGQAGLEHRKAADKLLNDYRQQSLKNAQDRTAVMKIRANTYNALNPLLRPLMTADKEYERQERYLAGELEAAKMLALDEQGNLVKDPEPGYSPGDVARYRAVMDAKKKYMQATTGLDLLRTDEQYQYVKEQLPKLREKMKELDPKVITGASGKPSTKTSTPAAIQGKGWSLTPK